MLLDLHLKGFILFLFEIIINYHANLNLAMVDTFIGEFDKAKLDLNAQWALIYIPFYFFSIWDSYHSAININEQEALVQKSAVHVPMLTIHTFGINYLDKKMPWVGAAWSAVLPGAGQFYLRRIIPALVLFIWSVIIYVNCHELDSLQLLINGHSIDSMKVLDPEWLLFLPSIIFGSAYDAYSKAIEINQLFEKEQRTYLKNEWPSEAKLFISKGGPTRMATVIGIFRSGLYVELSLQALQREGLTRESIHCFFLTRRSLYAFSILLNPTAVRIK
ncbi:hypothetical protein [Sporolactobacillus inulinus]|nr:hypothetical protein [Sporolactobacillus inulinus]